MTGAEGRFELTRSPRGRTRSRTTARSAGLSRPAAGIPGAAHVHLIVSADRHRQLITQLYLASSDYLDSDVAGAVKDALIVHPERRDGQLAFDYEFRPAPARAAVPAG